MSTILALLTGIIVFCSYLLFDKIRLDKQRNALLRARLSPDGTPLPGYDEAGGYASVSGEPSPPAAFLLGILRLLGIHVEEAMHRLSRKFAQAGLESPDAPVYYLFFQRVVSLLLFMFALLLFINARGHGAFLMQLVALFVMVIGLFGPHLFLKNMIERRKQVLIRAFPDTLDLLLICVESGLALDAALNRVCNELGRAYPEMTAELNRTRLELALINDRTRALMNLGERTDMVAFRSLTSALIQSEKFGTSLTDTLRVLSDEFRVQRLTDAEVKAARLPVIMTIPLIFLLMPAFFIVVMGPAIINATHSTKQMERGK